MEEDLKWLKALLIEHGGAELVIAIEWAAREEMPPLDARGELKLLFDELDTVLVQGCKTVAFTMQMLKAKTLSMHEDLAAFDVDSGTSTQSLRKDAGGIVFSQDGLGEWNRLANEADVILKKMRRHYDFA